MDSEHRHELQGNDLQEFLLHFNKFWNKYGTYVLLAILLVVAGVVGTRWFKGKEFRENEAAWTDLVGTSSPEGLIDVAERYKDRPGVAGFALLRASDMLAEQAVNNDADKPVDPAAKSVEDSKRLLERSNTLAQQVVDSAQTADPSLLKLNARLRLGANFESLGEWDKAAAQYQAIISGSGPYKTLAAQAADRLRNLATIKEPVVLPQAPEPKKDAAKTDTSDATDKADQPDADVPADLKAPAPAPAKDAAPDQP